MTNYEQGFIKECQAHGIDPKALLMKAAGLQPTAIPVPEPDQALINAGQTLGEQKAKKTGPKQVLGTARPRQTKAAQINNLRLHKRGQAPQVDAAQLARNQAFMDQYLKNEAEVDKAEYAGSNSTSEALGGLTMPLIGAGLGGLLGNGVLGDDPVMGAAIGGGVGLATNLGSALLGAFSDPRSIEDQNIHDADPHHIANLLGAGGYHLAQRNNALTEGL